MTVSLACADGDHHLCCRPSCDCLVCGHPERAATRTVVSPDVKPARHYRAHQPPRATVADIPMPECAELYQHGGQTLRSLALRYDCGTHLIARALRAWGVAIRVQGQHAR